MDGPAKVFPLRFLTSFLYWKKRAGSAGLGGLGSTLLNWSRNCLESVVIPEYSSRSTKGDSIAAPLPDPPILWFAVDTVLLQVVVFHPDWPPNEP
eukprot:14527582-Ditylum_brightwellii.AAC.1